MREEEDSEEGRGGGVEERGLIAEGSGDSQDEGTGKGRKRRRGKRRRGRRSRVVVVVVIVVNSLGCFSWSVSHRPRGHPR